MAHWPAATALLLAIALAVAACGGTGAPIPPTPVVRALTDGEVLGKVDRVAGGAVSGDILSLVGLSCDNGKLIVRMGSKTVTGVMDCKDMPPQALLERVLSKQVTVTYASGKVRVETTNGEAVEAPATDVVITDSNVTPGP